MAVKMLRAGELRHRLTVQQKTVVRDAHGGFSNTWTNLRTLYASIEPKSGREYQFADATRAEMTHAIMVRAQTEALTPDMRGLFDGRTFNFLAVSRLQEIRHALSIAALETVGTSQNTPGTAAAMGSVQYTRQTVEWNFTQTNTQTFTFPSNKYFFLDAVEVLVTQLTGTVVTQPTITVGITGNLTKYLNRLTTLLTANHLRQGYQNLGANVGETQIVVNQSVAGAVSVGGTYKGLVVLKGILVG